MEMTMRRGWGRVLLRATLIGTILQLALAIAGHYEARIGSLFAAGGMFLSLVAGFIFARLAAPIRPGAASLGGVVAGAVCAFIGIVESWRLGDVPGWVLAFGPCSSAVTGAVGGLLGRLTGRTA